MRIQVTIPLNYLEVFGSSSLTGLIVDQNPGVLLTEIKVVVLRIPKTSSKWKKKYGGPYLGLAPEYVFEEIILDVVRITSQGIKFEIEHYLIEP